MKLNHPFRGADPQSEPVPQTKLVLKVDGNPIRETVAFLAIAMSGITSLTGLFMFCYWDVSHSAFMAFCRMVVATLFILALLCVLGLRRVPIDHKD